MFGQSSTMEDWVWCPCQYSSYGHLFKDVCWFFSGDGESGCGAEDEHPFPALILHFLYYSQTLLLLLRLTQTTHFSIVMQINFQVFLHLSMFWFLLYKLALFYCYERLIQALLLRVRISCQFNIK